MDKPLGALDALAREKKNRGSPCSLKEAGKTKRFFTYAISEAVFLGTWAVVLTAGPAKMEDNFATGLDYPRTLDTKRHEAFGAETRHIYRLPGVG
jgi:NitT/TauT family transport system ATP-binding protein